MAAKTSVIIWEVAGLLIKLVFCPYFQRGTRIKVPFFKVSVFFAQSVSLIADQVTSKAQKKAADSEKR